MSGIAQDGSKVKDLVDIVALDGGGNFGRFGYVASDDIHFVSQLADALTIRIAIEQDQVVSTIQNYPAGKFVFFKPDTVKTKGGIPLPGPGGQKEDLLQSWQNSILQNGLKINEEESCKDIKKEDGAFRIITQRGKTKRSPLPALCTSFNPSIGNSGFIKTARILFQALRSFDAPS